MARLLTLRRNLQRLLKRDEVDDNFVNVATDFAGGLDPAGLPGATILPYMRWADTSSGWIMRRNAANNAWVPEQRMLRGSVQAFSQAEALPASDQGPLYVKGSGMAEWDATKGAYRVRSDVPLTSVQWWAQRAAIPAGWIPGDGQTVARATYPDLAQAAIDGRVPVVSEADWLADPLKRGAYTLGDGSTTIRVPDYNGQSAGSVGRVFLSGDGGNSAGAGGVIQMDAMQPIVGSQGFTYGAVSGPGTGPFVGSRQSDGPVRSGPNYSASNNGDTLRIDSSTVTRTAAESRPRNVTGCYLIKAFGVLVNPGSANAAQLASDLATLQAAIQTDLGFTILYPGGGNAAAPGNVTVNTRYVMPNPWPGSAVLCVGEIPIQGNWTCTGWRWLGSSDLNTQGLAAGQYGDSIVVQTGQTALWNRGDWQGSPVPASAANGSESYTTKPCRVKVWKLKGGAQNG